MPQIARVAIEGTEKEFRAGYRGWARVDGGRYDFTGANGLYEFAPEAAEALEREPGLRSKLGTAVERAIVGTFQVGALRATYEFDVEGQPATDYDKILAAVRRGPAPEEPEQ